MGYIKSKFLFNLAANFRKKLLIMVKKLLLLLFALNCMVGFAQKFSFVDAEGCSYSFRVTSTENHEVALVSASNKKHAKLEIPGTVTNKGVE